MKNFKNTLHQRKWLGVESTIRGDKTENPADIPPDRWFVQSLFR
jgi:hypothetical protein